jgi:ceroid-lipofuscinosis MFS transporter 7
MSNKNTDTEKIEGNGLVNDETGRLKMSSSVLIIAAVTFVGDSSRGVLFPVLWPLCQSLGGNSLQLGLLVSTFSFGRFLVTTPFGYFCDNYRHRITLLISNFLLLLGALCWANAYATRSIGFLYFAQLLMGVGSGTLGVTRSYVVEQTLPKYRTEILAIMTALQFAGFTVSPFIGSFLSFLGQLNTTTHYWEYSLPAYFIALLCLCCCIALFVTFKDIPQAEVVAKKPERKVSKATTPVTAAESDEKRGILQLIVIFIFLNITTKGSIAVYETLASQIAYSDYKISSLLLGLTISLSGAFGTLILLNFQVVTSYLGDDYIVMLLGVALMILAQFIICSYGGRIPTVEQYYCAVILMYAVAYPVGHTAILGAFSKIQKTGKQASLLGWFASAGSLARVVFPILSSVLNQSAKNSPFMLALICLCISIVYIIVSKPLIYRTVLNDSVVVAAIVPRPVKQVAMITYNPLDSYSNEDEETGDPEQGKESPAAEKGNVVQTPSHQSISNWEKAMIVASVAGVAFGIAVIATSTPNHGSFSFFTEPEDV